MIFLFNGLLINKARAPARAFFIPKNDMKDPEEEKTIDPSQMTLFDIIEDVTGENLCEVCKQPARNNIHPECADLWWNWITEAEETPPNRKKPEE